MKCCASPSTPFNSVLYGLINTSEIALFNFERESHPAAPQTGALKEKNCTPCVDGPGLLVYFKNLNP